MPWTLISINNNIQVKLVCFLFFHFLCLLGWWQQWTAVPSHCWSQDNASYQATNFVNSYSWKLPVKTQVENSCGSEEMGDMQLWKTCLLQVFQWWNLCTECWWKKSQKNSHALWLHNAHAPMTTTPNRKPVHMHEITNSTLAHSTTCIQKEIINTIRIKVT